MARELTKRFVAFSMIVITCVFLIMCFFVFTGNHTNLTFERFMHSFLVGLFLVFIASLIISKFALRPVEHSWQKQLDFAADASHELRTPLAVIRTNLEIVMDSPEETVQSQMKWLRNIEAEQLRMSKLVDDLLTLSRADGGSQDLFLTTFLLSELVQKTSDSFFSICHSKSICLEQNIDSQIAFTGDEKRITQLIIILLDNAVQYTASGGKITIFLHRKDNCLILGVQDTGMGMSASDTQKVFDRFYRSERTRQKNPEGSGLGLSIAKWIVEQHMGSIAVKSVLNEGTTFSISFKSDAEALRPH